MKTGTNMNTKKEDTPPMADIPTITPEMVEEAKIEISKRRAGRQAPPLKDIADATCSVCGSHAVSFTNDLVFEVVLAGEQIVIPNLTGLRCSNCGDFAFDADSSKIIDSCVHDLLWRYALSAGVYCEDLLSDGHSHDLGVGGDQIKR